MSKNEEMKLRDIGAGCIFRLRNDDYHGSSVFVKCLKETYKGMLCMAVNLSTGEIIYINKNKTVCVEKIKF